MTDLEVLRTVINQMDNISVPVQLTEQIGIPLYNSSNMLKNLYRSVVARIQEEEKNKAEAEPEEEMKLEVVPAEEEKEEAELHEDE